MDEAAEVQAVRRTMTDDLVTGEVDRTDRKSNVIDLKIHLPRDRRLVLKTAGNLARTRRDRPSIVINTPARNATRNQSHRLPRNALTQSSLGQVVGISSPHSNGLERRSKS